MIEDAKKFHGEWTTAATDVQRAVGGVGAQFGQLAQQMSKTAPALAQPFDALNAAFQRLAVAIGSGVPSEIAKAQAEVNKLIATFGEAAKAGIELQKAMDLSASAQKTLEACLRLQQVLEGGLIPEFGKVWDASQKVFFAPGSYSTPKQVGGDGSFGVPLGPDPFGSVDPGEVEL